MYVCMYIVSFDFLWLGGKPVLTKSKEVSLTDMKNSGPSVVRDVSSTPRTGS